jgi:uncharacterized protein (UPF0333 family)
MRLKNKLVILAIILFVVIGLVYFYPKKINKEYSGIQYRIGDDSYEAQTDITALIPGISVNNRP